MLENEHWTVAADGVIECSKGEGPSREMEASVATVHFYHSSDSCLRSLGKKRASLIARLPQFYEFTKTYVSIMDGIDSGLLASESIDWDSVAEQARCALEEL